jgi:hypothetical protein
MHGHSLLVLAGGILLAGAGVVLFGLAWRRRLQGQDMAATVETGPEMSRARVISPIVLVPVVGLLGSLAAVLASALLEGRLRPP